MAKSRGLGLAALVSRSLPSVQYSLGRRSQKPSSRIEDKVNTVANQIRPGTVTHLYSGQEPPGAAPVGAANRHPRGYAGDFKFYDETTKQQITDQQFFKDLSLAMAEQYNANIGYSEVGYMGIGSIHIDTMPLDVFGGGPVWGRTALSWANELAEARSKYSRPKDEVFDLAAMTREQALSQQAQEAAIAEAFNSPSRGLDVTTPPAALAAQYAQYQRAGVPAPVSPAALASQLSQYRPGTVPALSQPSRPVTPTPSTLAAAPVGQVTRAPLGAVAPALNAVRPSVVGSLPAARPAAPVQNAVRPALAPSGLPAARPQSVVATRPATPAPTGLPAAKAQTTIATRPSTPAPTGLPAASGPTTAQLAEQYGQYRTPTNYTNVRNAIHAAQPVNPVPATISPVAPPALKPAPPTAITPPAAVLAPALAPPKTIQDRPIAEMAAPPAAPKATAYDVYNGLAETALDNTGQNTVGTLPGGTTTVTNQYGVTTGMTPYGKQTAVGALPGITGPIGKAVKGAVPAIGGSLLGGFLGGPAGALLGAALMKEVAKPGGLLSGQNNFATNWFGNITTNKPQGGLGFPDAPSGGYGSGGRMGASYSNRSRADMDSISPGASAAIGKGLGGLY